MNLAPAVIRTMSDAALAAVRAVTAADLELPQVPITTHHLLHAGIYSRTILLPEGTRLTSVLIKRSTALILFGDVTVWVGVKNKLRLVGYHVIAASAHRKQVVYAHRDTHATMIFATKAKTVKEAEEEFTDESEILFSRRGENIIQITGE